MGYCSGLQQSCFHPLQYYRRSHPIPDNQLIHCPWRPGHLCTGNSILSLPFPLSRSHFSCVLHSEHRQTASVYLGHHSDHIGVLPPALTQTGLSFFNPHVHTENQIKSLLFHCLSEPYLSFLVWLCATEWTNSGKVRNSQEPAEGFIFLECVFVTDSSSTCWKWK